ncbi:MAG: serine protease [Treponema sp.]|jgi:serine protease Do|nr:serine protease [Treponema sp.]
MIRRSLLLIVFLFVSGTVCFGQTAALRDYVGMISQGFHPDTIEFLRKLKSNLEKKGLNDSVRSLEEIIKGDSGTGFVYVDNDGKNYILTNYHVISLAHTLSITFEKQDGEKTKFSDLTIVAADEDMDIALLAFAGGQKLFDQGLSLLTRPVQEGEDVYSAGFPSAGSAMIWQLGRGIISNASVRLPPEDENDKMIGPYIQHTAQIDAGNSGGPLLIRTPEVTAGFAVVGINTLSIRRRQAANYSIPLNRIQSFLDTSKVPVPADQRPLLEARVNAFVEGLNVPGADYLHIAKFLSNTCTGENAEYAVNSVLEKALKRVTDNIFNRSLIPSLTYAVAWTIEDSIRSKTGNISISVDSISPKGTDDFKVSFKVNNEVVESVWINEYGIWRILSFGKIASGDKTLIDDKEKMDVNKKAHTGNLHSDPFFQVSAGFAYPFDLGPAFGFDLGFRQYKNFGYGIRGFIGDNYAQFDASIDVFIPVIAGSVAITPYAKVGGGFMILPPLEKELKFDMAFGFSVQGGIQFTTAVIPGLYLQAGYQHNFYQRFLINDDWLHPNIILISIGFSFS